MGNLEECKEQIEQKRAGQKLILKKGDHVTIFDRFRFAIPLIGRITDFNENSVEVQLLTTNNPQYPVGSKTWVFKNQVKEDHQENKSYIESLKDRVKSLKEESERRKKEQEEKDRQWKAMENDRCQQAAIDQCLGSLNGFPGLAYQQSKDSLRLVQLENQLFNQRSRITTLEKQQHALIESVCKIFESLDM